jgi:hypothetical protein
MDSRPVLVVVIVVLTGCGAVPFGSDAPTTSTETLTPAPVSTPTKSNGTPIERPPGIPLDGVVNTDQLTEAHRSVVTDRSYRWTLDYEINWSGGSDGPERGFTRRAVVEPNQFLIYQVNDGQAPDKSLFVDETGGYLRIVTDNATRTETVAEPGASEDYASGGQLIERFLTGMNPNVSRVERGGEHYFRLHDRTGLPPMLNPAYVRDCSVTAYVTAEGFVRSMTIRYERSLGGDGERVSIRFYYEGVESTTVDRPAWVDGLSFSTPTPTASPLRETTTDTPVADNESMADTSTPTPTTLAVDNTTGN